MDSGGLRGGKRFVDTGREMARISREASERYDVEANAVFARLADVTRALSKGGGKGIAWPVHSNLACCSMGLADANAAREGAGRGQDLLRDMPQQCDVMVVGGWVTKAMAPRLLALYEQMAEPRHVIAFGECAASGGPWWQSYSMIQGIDQVLPVDVYVVGCPPRPENLVAALMKLQDKVGGKVAGNPERSVSENIRREKAGRV